MDYIQKAELFFIEGNDNFNSKVVYDERIKFINLDIFQITANYFKIKPNISINNLNPEDSEKLFIELFDFIVTYNNEIYQKLLKKTTKKINDNEVLIKISETIIRYYFFIKELSG